MRYEKCRKFRKFILVLFIFFIFPAQNVEKKVTKVTTNWVYVLIINDLELHF